MKAHRLGVPAAIALTAVAALVATLALSPRDTLDPAPVEAGDYFTAQEIERAEEYRGPQRALGIAGLVVSGATLALLALRPPPRARRLLERAEAGRPYRGAAAVGGALSLALAATGLPFDAVAHVRARDVGLSTQGWVDWFGDLGKSAAIGAALAGAGAMLGLALVRRFPRGWWAPGAVAVVGVGALFTFVAPVVLDPVFNRFEPLPQGALRSEVLDLAERSGVEVGEVYRIDASRRTTGANAYVGGLGSTKRVVLYDNLIEGFPPEEVRSVVAHELAHVRFRDLTKGLLWLAIVAPAATLLLQRLSERFEGGGGPLAGTSRSVPALALAVAIVSFGVSSASNVLSRQVEARADAHALELTGDPAAAIALARRLTTSNVSDPDPPAALHLLFGTHPRTLERIGFAVTYGRGRGGASGPGGRPTARPSTRAGS